MRVAFRVDASIEMGTGHVMRCLTLASALRKAGTICHFITRELPGNLAAHIRSKGFSVTLLPAPQGPTPEAPPAHAAWAGENWQRDSASTRAALSAEPPDWLVLDHYAFDERWEDVARPRGTKLLVIDDLADRPHLADLLLDQNLGRRASDYDPLLPSTARRIVGPHYALLRPGFAALREASLAGRGERKPRRLLISMGGVDVADATSRILLAMKTANLPPDASLIIIMGNNSPALPRVRKLAAELPWSAEVAVNVNDMPSLMAEADLAIGAAGTTTWERCCLGLPTIITETAANQAGIARNMIAAGAALYPGSLLADDFPHRLRRVLEQAMLPDCLAALSAHSARICDGGGTERVVAVMNAGTAP